MTIALSEAPPRRLPGRPPGFGRPQVSSTLRLDPDVRQAVIEAAQREGVSVNTWIERAIKTALDQERPAS